MAPELAIFDVHMPALVVLALLGACVAAALDRVFAALGVYRCVWHPALFRASVLALCICVPGLLVYR